MGLQEIINGIKDGSLNYGQDKEYLFQTDEDGVLRLLKKTNNDHDNWSYYDDEVVFDFDTSENRGLSITEYFLDSLNIEYQG